MTFTLTLLRTGTDFTLGKTQDYDKTETLSYIPTLINPASTKPGGLLISNRKWLLDLLAVLILLGKLNKCRYKISEKT